MKIVNQIRLLGEELEEKRIVEKVIMTLPENFEAKISSLEGTWDMSQISLNELSNALLVVEQRKAYREEETNREKALVVTHKTKIQEGESTNTSHHAQVTENSEKYEEQLFAANEIKKCDVSIEAKELKKHVSLLIVATKPNLVNFDSLDTNYSSKVRLRDGRLVDVKGKGDVIVQTPSGTKLVSDILYVPELNQSLFSVGQLLDKNYSLLFKAKTCEISDPSGSKLFAVKIK
ncbi:uncharacterized protein LOC119369554 [Jatropha curcas]|uniref:uncharacterized protein LOC119369554 n=1 Tax=Jatropha curcas TaxID=180498 RepID=UPI0018937D56|nr:uncharacterized protein LOC119369554 [Jatropha curcas]